MPTNLKNQKEEKRAALIRSLGISKTSRAIVISFIQDQKVLEFLDRACNAIGVKLLTDKNNLILEGADAFIADVLSEDIPLLDLTGNAVVPIVPQVNPYSKALIEFNPMKFEGNAFLFEEKNEFQIFEKLVRYLENIRYSGDKRTLLKNVTETTI